MRFDARVLTADQRIVRLSLEASDAADAKRQLEAQSLRAMDVRPALVGSMIRRRSRFPLILFTQELLALLRAGLGIVEALEALEQKESVATTRSLIKRLLQMLLDGNRLSTALTEHPSIFPPMYVGLVKSAEGTSDLPVALERYVTYQTRVDTVRNKIVSASLYPMILCVAGGAVTLFLMGYVVPRFSMIYQDTGRPLPFLSQAMMDSGKFVAHHTLELLAGVGGAALAFFAAARSYIAKGGLSRLLSSLPLIGEHVRMYQLSRFYLTLGVLLEGGMPILDALRSAGTVVPRDWERSLRHVSKQVEDGYALSGALEGQRMTTSVSVRMLRVGEQSGQMAEMLRQAAQFYEGDISRFIDRFTRTFEPLLMAAIGIIVGGIVVLLYMPIFDLAASLQ